ncbi:hypothetical protein B0H17DRAFT_1050354 [Mycena rosella]|uniref:RING-type domain-containing protein n=1 Tax=Mycena rosella TaxID=1033263 RepID=A0AAD7GK21_MYCRO|nr:hypothetical protein B0H17DRAFT_1050354 [Mycena rosella]
MSNRSKTLSPQSSTSSFNSGSYTELSDSSSGLDLSCTRRGHGPFAADRSDGMIVAPTAVNRKCALCSGASFVQPTVITVCGHIFCKECITAHVAKTSKCPECASTTLLYCLLPLHLYTN